MSVVLTFHKVDDPNWFYDVVSGLSTRYRMISPCELYRSFIKSELDGKSCLVTVDDGDFSYYSVIHPVLKELAIPSLLFVSPQYIT